MSYVIGLLMGLGSLMAAMHYLDQPLSQFFDAVAFAVVIGGTVAVGIITLPWEHWRLLLSGVTNLFRPGKENTKELLSECMTYIRSVLSGQSASVRTKGFAGEVLKDGYELISLRFETSEIEMILQERVDQNSERNRAVADSLRSLAKYPPAFGLAGTVLGLVSLMRAITEGLDTRETGARMAIALVATLYGLMLANLILSPMGESIQKRVGTDTKRAELALQAVLLASDRISLLKAQEMLNSHVPNHLRVDVINAAIEADFEQDAA